MRSCTSFRQADTIQPKACSNDVKLESFGSPAMPCQEDCCQMVPRRYLVGDERGSLLALKSRDVGEFIFPSFP